MSSPFAARTSVEGVEEEMLLAPKIEANRTMALTFTENTKTFEPATLYGDTPNLGCSICENLPQNRSLYFCPVGIGFSSRSHRTQTG